MRYLISIWNFIYYLFANRWLNEQPVRDYTIKRGNNYSNRSVYRPVKLKKLRFLVLFTDSCKYQTYLPINQHDINKLLGFTDGSNQPHSNSARIGWGFNPKDEYTKDKIQLYSYVYDNGVLDKRELDSFVPFNEWIECSIEPVGYAGSGPYWKFETQRPSVTSRIYIPRTRSYETIEGILLYPYFGGDEKAPHNITIKIKIL